MNKYYKPRTVRDMLIKSSELYVNNNAFLLKNSNDETYSVTYKTFRSDVDALSLALTHTLSLKGRHIAVSGRNSYEWCLAYMAVMSGVGVIVPIDKELNGEEISELIRMGDVEALIADREVIKKLKENGQLSDTTIIICSEKTDDENILSFEKLMLEGYSLLEKGYLPEKEESIDPYALAVLLFTSGTTGIAKGVMLSNDNLCSDLAAVCRSVEATPDDISLSVLPLHHTYEAISMLMMLFRGGCITFSKGFRHLLREFSDYKPTVFVCVPLILEKMHRRIITALDKQGKLKKTKLLSLVSSNITEEKKRKIFAPIHQFFGGRLKKIIVGAAALSTDIAQDFELFGINIIIGYGLTECSPIVICNSDNKRTPDSVGKPLEGVSVKLMKKDDKGIGEIHVKGPMVMLGYYKNKKQTENVLQNGWFNTGDLGYEDKSGNWHITGRSKNIIVTSTGKNIYPEELELYLSRSPLVAECLVYSEDDTDITAEILPDYDELKLKSKNDSPDEKEIYSILNDVVKSVNRKIPQYKRIRKLIIRDREFIKTTTHKIKRDKYKNNSHESKP